MINNKTPTFEEESPRRVKISGGGKLSDPQIIRALEAAMDEMVRFEVSDQSPYAYQMRKVYEFKDYMMDYLLMQYGLKNIATKTFDLIISVSLYHYSFIYI